MLRTLLPALVLWSSLNVGQGFHFAGQIDKIFSVLANQKSECDVNSLPETVQWCNGTLTVDSLLPHFTLCQTNDLADDDLLCRNGVWWSGKTPYRPSRRSKRSGISAVLTLEKKETCTWICAVDETDFIGKRPPVFDYCPNSTVLYPAGNSTQVFHEWQTPIVRDIDGNITSFEQIIGPKSGSLLDAAMTPGNIYHVSYMAEDDESLKWTCSFTIDAEIPVCPAIVNFKHGEYSCDHDNYRGSTCTLRCEEGYYLNTTNTTTCQDDGTWSFGDEVPECFPISCGSLTVNSSDIQFMCYQDSHEYGSVCWARCLYGYILRNDKQEEEQEAELSALVDLAQIRYDNAVLAKGKAETLIEQARNNEERVQEETDKVVAENETAANIAAQAKAQFDTTFEAYNKSLTTALQAELNATEAYERNDTNADELLELANNLTAITEQLKVKHDAAYVDYIRASEAAASANADAIEAVNKLAAAQMYLNETEINFENKIEEEADAFQSHNDAIEKLSAAKIYNGRDDKVVNTFARCEADGTWNIPGDPFCIDTEPPLLKCIPIYNLYLDPGKSTINGIWPLPQLQEDVQDSADIIQISGPGMGSTLSAGQYVVSYIARDTSGNVSPNCTIIINVEARSCVPVALAIPDENMIADCYNYTAGSTCSLTCRQNYYIAGNDWTTCEDDQLSTDLDFVWSFDNVSCIEDYCPELTEPLNGKIVCENMTEGGICNVVCNDNYMLPHDTSSVYNCDETGVWSSTRLPSRCIERGELQVAVHTLSISYFSTNVSDTCIQSELEDEQVAIETALRSHLQTFQTCEEEYECMMKQTSINCSEEDDGLRTLTLDIITTCPDNLDVPCDLTLVIMENFESDLTYSIEDEGILDHLNVSLATDWLNPVSVDIPVCLNGSVLVRAYCAYCDIGYFLESSTSSCLPCPIGTYGDKPGLSSCKACPSLTNTTGTGSISREDCRDLCMPGSYSETTMVPCVACELGTFQPNYGGTQCLECPGGNWTTIPGGDSVEKCVLFDIYFEKEFPEQDIGFTFLVKDMTAIFWIKGYDIPIISLGLYYDDTDFAFKLITEENIQIFTDGWDNTPTGVQVNKNEWILLAVTWEVLPREIRLYRNGKLAFSMKAKERPEIPTKVVLFVKEETFLSGFVMFPYIASDQILASAYNTCVPAPGYNILAHLASFRLPELKPVPSTCQASEYTVLDSCGNHGCQNDGVCVQNDTFGYTCNCTEGYGGLLCEVELVHGNWSEWINASDCSVTCGSGARAVYRLCNNPTPGLYGNDCEGNSTDFVECHLEPCGECETLPETDQYGTICELKDEECTPSCPDGRVLPKGQREQKFRCGVSTNYEWVPVNRLPVCARVSKPESYIIVATFDVRPEVPCEYLDNITAGFEENVAELPCPYEIPNCTSKVEFEDCIDETRRKREILTTKMAITFEVTLTDDGDFDLEEYFLTRNITPSIEETVTAIYVMELSIKEIIARPEELDVLFLNVTYTIVPGSEVIVAMTTCPAFHVDTQGVCVQCQPGTRQSTGWCIYCDRGSYQDGIGRPECILCPEGTTTYFTGARSERECIEIITEPPPPTPPVTDIGPIIIIVVCVIAGIFMILVLVCTILKFYITSKRRQQYDMEAETTSLFTEFPDIAYNMYFKNRQVLGFDEKGLPIIAKDGLLGDDAESPFPDAYSPFGGKEEKLPPLIPHLEPFSFSARPVSDMPFDHPPPKLKKKSFIKPSLDPIKHFNFPDMREIPVRFRVPKRKGFQNKYPRHMFGLPEEEGYVSQKVPIPKNATRLLYKSPTGENIYAYLFKDGLVRMVDPLTGDLEIGVQPDLPLLKAQYLGEDGEFEYPPPVFEKLKLGDEPTDKLKRRVKGSATGSRLTWDSRPSTAMPRSRPSTTKSKVQSARSHGSPRSSRSPRSGRSARSRGEPQMDSYRSLLSSESPRAKSAMLRSGSRSAKSVSIKENGYVSRPTTAGTFLSQARSSRHANGRLLSVAETYRPKSINLMDYPDDFPPALLPPGTPVSSPRADDQVSTASTQLKDHKSKLMAPPAAKVRPKSVTPVPPPDDTENEAKDKFEGKGVRFDDDGNMDDIESDHADSDSSGSVIFTKSKKLTEKRPSRVSHTSPSRSSRVSMNGGVSVSRTPRTSVSGGPAPKPVLEDGVTSFRPSKDFTETFPALPPRSAVSGGPAPKPVIQDGAMSFRLSRDFTEGLPALPPRGHQMRPMIKPTVV